MWAARVRVQREVRKKYERPAPELDVVIFSHRVYSCELGRAVSLNGPASPRHSSFLLEHFDGIPSLVGRILLIFERSLEVHLGEGIIGIELEKL